MKYQNILQNIFSNTLHLAQICVKKSLIAGFAACLLASNSYANNWQASIYDESLPKHIVAVDKYRQSFLVFEKHSPLKLTHSFNCTTGQLSGDKQVMNDLRTPEGVYFVEYYVPGLDFREYGGLAYTLNYPNPVDRLRGKTGSGIWIHSKGYGIYPRDTRGCVAISLKDIQTIRGNLLGSAVILAEHLDEKKIPMPDNGTAKKLKLQMQEWSKAWSERSPRMFEFYNPEAYEKSSSENFETFRQTKQNVFNSVEYINIYNKDIYVLEGPGYWVTWSEQLYNASNMSVEGIRRLYWQADKNGNYRIVGMEWIPSKLGLWAALRNEKKASLSDATEMPVEPQLTVPEDVEDKVQFKEQLIAADSRTTKQAPSLNTEIKEEITKQLRAWENALVARDAKAFSELYSAKEFNRVANVPRSFARNKTLNDLNNRYSNALLFFSKAVQISKMADIIKTESSQLLIGGRYTDQGVRTLYWKKIDGKYLVIAESFQNSDQGLEEIALNQIGDAIKGFIENWSKAWEVANVDAYCNAYSQNAIQGSRRGLNSIRQHKITTWANAKPKSVQLSKLHLAIDKGCIRAEMMQNYADVSGYEDQGIKTLYLQFDGHKWQIIREDWRKSDATALSRKYKPFLVADLNKDSANSVSDAHNSYFMPKLDKADKLEYKEKLVAADPLVPRSRYEREPDEIGWQNSQDGADNFSKLAKERQKEADKAAKARLESENKAKENAKNESNTLSNVSSKIVEDLSRQSRAWENALVSRDSKAFTEFYSNDFNKIQNIPSGLERDKTLNDLNNRYGNSTTLVSKLVKIASEAENIFRVEIAQMLIGGKNTDQGLRVLYWKKDNSGKYSIVAEQFQVGDQGLVSMYLEKVSPAIYNVIENWGHAWEVADLDTYMDSYSKDAIQLPRKGADSIRQHKITTWARSKPKSVKLSGIRLSMDNGCIKADMLQTYVDSNGYEDQGVKTLLLQFDGEQWKIIREDWRKAESNALLETR